jgi:hypothetical protein
MNKVSQRDGVRRYVERVVRTEEQADEELERLALKGLNSGEPIETPSTYWEEQHRRLDQRLKKTGVQ